MNQVQANPAFACTGDLGMLRQIVCDTPYLAHLDHELEKVLQAASAAGDLDSPQVSWMEAQPRRFLNELASPCPTAAIGQEHCITNAYASRIASVLVASPAARDVAVIAKEPINIICSDFNSPIVAVTFDLPVPAIVVDWTHGRFIGRGMPTSTETTYKTVMRSAVVVEGKAWSGKDQITLAGGYARVVLAGQPEMACTIN